METITINQILYVLITVALPLVLKYAYQLVAMKLAGSKYEDAVSSIYDAVAYVNQTFVDSLKKSGKFDEQSAELAFIKAKEAALAIMKRSTVKWLEKTYTDLDSWFTVQIESAVKANKKEA